MATAAEVREAIWRNDADCYRLAKSLEPPWLRAQVWAEVLMDQLSKATAPKRAADVYKLAEYDWHLPQKTCQRAVRAHERRRGDTLYRKRLHFDGQPGSTVLIWTRARWRRFKAATYLSTEPQDPGRLREQILRKAARKTKPPVEFFKVPYTCAGCGGQFFKKSRRSPRKTCSSKCRQWIYRKALQRIAEANGQ